MMYDQAASANLQYIVFWAAWHKAVSLMPFAKGSAEWNLFVISKQCLIE